MLRSVQSFFLLAALVLLVSPSLVVAAPGPDADPDTSLASSGSFQLNLARRFTSTVAQLKSRSGRFGGVTKTSKAKPRSISDELVAMLKGALSSPARPPSRSDGLLTIWSFSAASSAFHPSSSPSVHAATSRPSSTHRPSSRPSSKAFSSASALVHAATNTARPSNMAVSNAKRQLTVDEVKRRIMDEPWENLDSRLLCPVGEEACPIFPRMGTYECIDTKSELESCGGCSSRGLGEDCTLIRGAQGVTCESGHCNVYSCQLGWKLDADFRRPGGGQGTCSKITASGTGIRGAKAKRATTLAEQAQ
ncbi:hypothetical protein JCM1841_003783 [Sporobolomyces salmonicolor]